MAPSPPDQSSRRIGPVPGRQGANLRRGRGRAVLVERLEGRTLLAASALDPTFHGGRPILNKVDLLSKSQNNATVVAGLTLSRLNADGSVDATFGTQARLNSFPQSIAVQADGKILVGGSSTLSGLGTLAFPVLRFTAAGFTDGSFGPGGTAPVRVTSSTAVAGAFVGDRVTGLALAADGRVVAVGTLVYSRQGVGRDGSGAYSGTQAVVARLKAANPVAGDDDRDGRTDVAAYFPNQNVFACRVSSTGKDVLPRFGVGNVGVGATIPAPGDYEGDGRTDLAVYLPARALFADRPSVGGGDRIQSFGAAGLGRTIPAPSIPYAQPNDGAVGLPSGASGAARSAAEVPLTDDLINALLGTTTTRKKTSAPIT